MDKAGLHKGFWNGKLLNGKATNLGNVWGLRGFLGLVIAVVILSFAYFAFAAPTQSGISWKDNFSDSAGISTISYLNFSKNYK